jgi:hypothetical protein
MSEGTDTREVGELHEHSSRLELRIAKGVGGTTHTPARHLSLSETSDHLFYRKVANRRFQSLPERRSVTQPVAISSEAVVLK